MENVKKYISYSKAKFIIKFTLSLLLLVNVVALVFLCIIWEELDDFDERRIPVLTAYVLSIIFYIIALIISSKKRFYFRVMIFIYFLFFIGIFEVFILSFDLPELLRKKFKDLLVVVISLSLSSYCLNGFMIIILHVSKRTFLYDDSNAQKQIDKIERIEQGSDHIDDKL